ncbi:hypothetical protein [Thioflexithrix psekupsensis]|uniref:Uncharacterized protein n=1 Tax=Thioflexithrix psekupsensis TaxID=1570016 RepID=A0A251XBF1_9GAMM|nr:hypothetical protein [Thioflexithrix psekupsensis]OUD15420.1 hypothetical protein TPSD3_02510 [Thioflexithrix psekupsensis]
MLNGLFYIEFTEEFPLNLHHLQVYFPNQNETAPQILAQLQQDCPFETVLIIYNNSGVSTSQFIFIQSSELTAWLLHKNPLLNFCHLLAKNMELKQLSPFQNYGTVHLHNVFLTRQSILKTILANPMQNYALIGGRQLGKTSILKFLLNYYQNKSLECHYLIVRDNSLLQLLKSILKSKKKQLILLDEADDFIAHDRAKGYPILQHLQHLHLNGKISIIFAGHYELLTEWHSNSPYRDFAEAILVETFNINTCQSFIENSLQYLNCRFIEQESLTQFIKMLGGRPNLIITACQDLLSLEKQQVEKNDVEKVLNGLKPNLLAQVGLSSGEAEQILEKILILTALFTQQSYFSQQDMCRILENFGFSLSDSLIQSTIQRLSLAGIFRLEKATYVLTIPLLRQVFLQDSIGLLLAQNITQYKAWRRMS